MVEDWLESQGETPHELTLQKESDLQAQLVSEQLQPKKSGQKRKRSHLLEIRTDDDWISLVSAVQRVVARNVERAGIAIEANPTSNLAISGLEKIENLPIFRQYPVRDGEGGLGTRLRMSISTDDPGIFQTGLRDEYDALATAALGTGLYSRGEVLAWLDRLRQISYESSFIQGRAWPGERFLDYLLRLTGAEPRVKR
jgi:hypothetical protein